MLYIDCFSGASGDMILGALLDLGLPLDALKSALGSLAIEYGDVSSERVQRAGVGATKFRLVEHVAHGEHSMPAPSQPRSDHHEHHHSDQHAHHHEHHHENHHAHHHLKHIVAAIRRSALKPESRDRAVYLFERVAQAEASVHNTPIEKVHLHEVGALDSIIDIVGAVYGFEWFGVEDIEASPLNVGGGVVECAHGTFPVPAPATALLLRGVPVYGEGNVELVTPTGAVLITGYAKAYGPLPAMRIEKTAYGAGDRDPKGKPNVLRILNGPRATDHESRTTDHGSKIVKIECEIDDMNPQFFGPLMDRLLGAGALDVFYTPVQMKKNRPGTLVTVLVPPARRQALTDLLFRDSTTIGVRYEEMSRACLERVIEEVRTPYGLVRFKIARQDGRELNASPEFEDCERLALEQGVSIKEVQASAIRSRQSSVPSRN